MYNEQVVMFLFFCITHLESARPELHCAEDQIQHNDSGGPEARDHLCVQGSCSHWRRLRQLWRRDWAGDEAWRWVLANIYTCHNVLFIYSFSFVYVIISYCVSLQLRGSRSSILSVFSLHLLCLVFQFFFLFFLLSVTAYRAGAKTSLKTTERANNDW